MSQRLAAIALAVVEHLALAALALVVMAPFVLMIATSLKPADLIFSDPLVLIPQRFAAVENYAAALTRVPMLRFLVNGALVVSAILVIQVTVALFCAYALAKLRFRGAGIVFGGVLLGLCVPIQVPAISR